MAALTGHTYTSPRRAHTPAAPPRWERDEEMGQRRRSTSTYGRVQLCATLPGVSHFPGQPRPCEAGKWRLPRTSCCYYPSPTAHPPTSLSLSPTSTSRRPSGLCLRAPSALRHPAQTHTPHAHTRQTRVLPSKEKKNAKEETSGGDSPQAVPKHNSQTRSGPGALGGACRTAAARRH